MRYVMLSLIPETPLFVETTTCESWMALSDTNARAIGCSLCDSSAPASENSCGSVQSDKLTVLDTQNSPLVKVPVLSNTIASILVKRSTTSVFFK